MLEHHTHVAAVHIDIYLWIRNIHTIENNLAAGRILHTVQATEKGTFSGTGRTNNNDNLSFFDVHVDSIQNLVVSKALLQINDFDHSSSVSFLSV